MWGRPLARQTASRGKPSACAVYNGTLGVGFGYRFDRISNADLAFAKVA
ncbi:MAG: hypothetical protein JWQ55_5958 [Rhodopila sp.]|jgi:hypothetical protein|nr:hypothetical protein [Rhodopila sp.]